MKHNVMYMVVDELSNRWIYTIEEDLDCAIEIARQMNDEENQKYHHYVVEECTRYLGESWLQSWMEVEV